MGWCSTSSEQHEWPSLALASLTFDTMSMLSEVGIAVGREHDVAAIRAASLHGTSLTHTTSSKWATLTFFRLDGRTASILCVICRQRDHSFPSFFDAGRRMASPGREAGRRTAS